VLHQVEQDYNVANHSDEIHAKIKEKTVKSTFLFIAQNLQSDGDGGRIWLTTSLFTGTLSFLREALNLDDSLTAITFGE